MDGIDQRPKREGKICTRIKEKARQTKKEKRRRKVKMTDAPEQGGGAALGHLATEEAWITVVWFVWLEIHQNIILMAISQVVLCNPEIQ